jgi:O-antigen ligase
MNREVWDRWCERGILALVLSILVLGPVALGAVRNLEFAIIQCLTAGVLLLWMVRLWLAPRARLLWPPICWAVLAVSVYAAIRYWYSDIEYLARLEMLRVLVYAFLFIAILNNLHRQETIQLITFTLLALAMVIAFYAVYQFVTGSNKVWGQVTTYPHRGSGTYFSPNHLGGFLEMLLPLALAYTLTGRLKPVTRIVLGYFSLAILAGIGVSVSKGSWIATAVAMVPFFGVLVLQRRYRIPAVALLALLIASCFYLYPKSVFFQLRLKQMFNQNGTVNDELRYSVWMPAVRMWQEHSWWGVGLGEFNARFGAYRPLGIQMSPEYAHNDYLNSLADWGSVGTVLIASAWLLLAVGVFKTWSSVRLSTGELGGKSGSNKFAVVFGASVGLIALLVHSVVDFNMHIPANAILAVTLMALISSHVRFATEAYWFRVHPVVKALMSVAIVSGMFYLTSQGFRQASEFVWLQRAARVAPFSTARIQLLSRAFDVEPKNAQIAYVIGEAFRQQSQEGGQHYEGQEGVDYRVLGQKAMEWFLRSGALNPWDSRPWTGYGWCLDWFERSTESGAYFWKAEQLDPNNYHNVNQIGQHYVETGDYAAARPWFERSLRLQGVDNEVAQTYANLCVVRLEEAATNDLAARIQLLKR